MTQQATTDNRKCAQIPWWKRLSLVTAMLLSAGSFTVIGPSQAIYANASRPNTSHHISEKVHETIKLLVVCKAGNGGKGGSAMQKSNGAAGGPGGNCIVNIPIKVFLTIQHPSHHK